MNNKIKVLHFANPINRNDFVDSVVRFLDPSKFEVSVCTFNEQTNIAAPNYKEEGIKHFVLNVSGRKQYLQAIRKLAAIIKSEKIDILHTHLFDEAFLGSMVARFVPHVKFVLGRHYSDELYLTAKGFQRKKSLLIENIAISRADVIIAASSFIENLLIKQGIPPHKIRRVNYGFDFASDKYQLQSQEETSRIRQELGLGDDTFVVANIGRHYFLKGQPFLLKAFSKFLNRFPNSKLLMVGDGPQHAELKDVAIALKIDDNVIFTGWRKDGYKIIGASDVIVQPTLTEAFPQIMVETMALAKPLVITPVSGPCDQVKNMDTGYLIQVQDTESILNTLVRIRENNSEAKRIGNNAREYVLEHLDMNKVIGGYEEIYTGLLGR